MADRYWIGATDTDPTNTANWSTSSGGAGGASVPTTNDTAIFDSNFTNAPTWAAGSYTYGNIQMSNLGPALTINGDLTVSNANGDRSALHSGSGGGISGSGSLTWGATGGTIDVDNNMDIDLTVTHAGDWQYDANGSTRTITFQSGNTITFNGSTTTTLGDSVTTCRLKFEGTAAGTGTIQEAANNRGEVQFPQGTMPATLTYNCNVAFNGAFSVDIADGVVINGDTEFSSQGGNNVITFLGAATFNGAISDNVSGTKGMTIDMTNGDMTFNGTWTMSDSGNSATIQFGTQTYTFNGDIAWTLGATLTVQNVATANATKYVLGKNGGSYDMSGVDIVTNFRFVGVTINSGLASGVTFTGPNGDTYPYKWTINSDLTLTRGGAGTDMLPGGNNQSGTYPDFTVARGVTITVPTGKDLTFTGTPSFTETGVSGSITWGGAGEYDFDPSASFTFLTANSILDGGGFPELNPQASGVVVTIPDGLTLNQLFEFDVNSIGFTMNFAGDLNGTGTIQIDVDSPSGADANVNFGTGTITCFAIQNSGGMSGGGAVNIDCGSATFNVTLFQMDNSGGNFPCSIDWGTSTWNISGDLDLESMDTSTTPATARINMVGTASSSINSPNAVQALPKIYMQRTAGTVTLASELLCYGLDLTAMTGTLDAASFTIFLNGNSDLSGAGTVSNGGRLQLNAASITVDLGGRTFGQLQCNYSGTSQTTGSITLNSTGDRSIGMLSGSTLDGQGTTTISVTTFSSNVIFSTGTPAVIQDCAMVFNDATRVLNFLIDAGRTLRLNGCTYTFTAALNGELAINNGAGSAGDLTVDAGTVISYPVRIDRGSYGLYDTTAVGPTATTLANGLTVNNDADLRVNADTTQTYTINTGTVTWNTTGALDLARIGTNDPTLTFNDNWAFGVDTWNIQTGDSGSNNDISMLGSITRTGALTIVFGSDAPSATSNRDLELSGAITVSTTLTLDDRTPSALSEIAMLGAISAGSIVCNGQANARIDFDVGSSIVLPATEFVVNFQQVSGKAVVLTALTNLNNISMFTGELDIDAAGSVSAATFTQAFAAGTLTLAGTMTLTGNFTTSAGTLDLLAGSIINCCCFNVTSVEIGAGLAAHWFLNAAMSATYDGNGAELDWSDASGGAVGIFSQSTIDGGNNINWILSVPGVIGKGIGLGTGLAL